MSFGVFSCCKPTNIPQIVANPMTLAFQQFLSLGATSSQQVSVTGTNLTTDITITAPSGYEVSLNGTTWTTSVVITQTSGSASGTLYVRLNSTSAGNYNGNVVLSSAGASNVDVVCNGVCLNTQIAVNPTSLSFTKHNPLPSASQSFLVSGSDLVGNLFLNVAPSFEISLDNINFFPSLSLSPTAMIVSPTTIYVRFVEQIEGTYNINVVCTSLNATTVNEVLTGIYEIRNAYEFAPGSVPTIAAFSNNYVPSISNAVIVGDIIYFDNVGWVPIVGSKFNSSTTLLNVITSKAEIKRCFGYATSLLTFKGKVNIVDLSAGMFSGCTSLNHVDAKFSSMLDTNFASTAISDFGFMKHTTSLTFANFQGCINANNFDFSGLITPDFGVVSIDDSNFNGITGNNITIVAKVAHQTNNGGLMDGDLDTLNTLNTCIFTWVP